MGPSDHILGQFWTYVPGVEADGFRRKEAASVKFFVKFSKYEAVYSLLIEIGLLR